MEGNGLALSDDRNAIVRFLRRFPLVPAAVIAIFALALTGNKIENNYITFAVMIAGFVAILITGIVLLKKGRLTNDAVINLLFAAGFLIKLGYILYTDDYVRQCDVGEFREGSYINSHADYILYIRDYMGLPDWDVTQHGQFYHPPFHHFICAVFLKIYELFLPKGTHNYESLQTLTLLYAQGCNYYMYKILKQLGIKEKALVNAQFILAAFPMLTLFAGSLNNDVLCQMLFFAAFYYGFRWYGEGKTKDIIISAFCVGFGMMTKLSVGMIAFPMGFLFIVRFFKDIKAKKGLKSFGQLAGFACIAAPLGLWYSFRNLIRYNTPLGHINGINLRYQDISRFSVKDRLFGFYGFPIEDFYVNLGTDGEQDYNIFITQVKTMLFGYENCRDDMLMTLTGYFLLLMTLLLICVAVIGLVYLVVTIGKRGKVFEDTTFIILFLVEVISMVLYSLKLPHICSQDFRLNFPALLGGVYFVARLSESKPCEKLPGKGLRLLCIAFFFMSILYYAILWSYVKGPAIVVEPTW